MTDDQDPPPTITDQFGGLPMGELIGGPLAAASRANAQLAQSTLDFINRIGVAPPPGGAETPPGATRTDPLIQPTGPGLGSGLPDVSILPFAPPPPADED